MTKQTGDFMQAGPPGGVRRLLRDSVFYPCSGMHGRPVELLGHRWQTFIYADYDIDPEQLETECRERGFRGYDLDNLEFLPWNTLFEGSQAVAMRGRRPVPAPFIALSAWNRQADVSYQHGPERFTLWFIRLEAVMAYRELYVRQGVAPHCLVDIRPGLAFGGNYPGYRKALGKALLENRAGLPSHFLHDLDASEIAGLPYRAILDRYEPVGQGEGSVANPGMWSLVLARQKSSNTYCSLQLEPDH